ncbi:PP2C family protein-serine/threonine phosphatase [Streptomyces sp. NPDC054863]
MSQTHQLSACPGCEEPLETGDSFCEVCGYDLTAVPQPPDDRPTVAIGTHAPGTEPAVQPVNGHGGGADERPAHPPTADMSAPDFGEGDSGEDTADLPVVQRPTVADYPLAAPAASEAEAQAGAQEGAGAGGQAGAEAGAAKMCVACRAGRIDTDGYCENCGHAQPRERDHQERELASVAAVSDRGLRHHRNEDAFAISEAVLPDGSTATIAVVCDGVSSATRPDEASAAAAATANTLLLESLPRGTHPQQALHEAILAAAEAVNVLAAQQAQPMEHDPHRHQNAPACTLVSSIVAGGLLVVGWIGDSRVYWVPDDRSAPPARLTEDDSWAAQMVAAGLMGEAEAYADDRAHAITGWLGADAYEIDPHTASFKPDRPGVVVVCTDGLWNYAEAAQEMAHVIPADAAQRPLHSAQVLVGHALDGGGHDNVTVAVLPFPMLPQGAGSA